MSDPDELMQRLREGAAESPEAYAAALCQALSIWSQRDAAARALARIGAPAVEPLCLALVSKDAGVRACAARVLGRIGDARAVPALCDLLRDLDASVRGAALAALVRMGDPGAAAPLLLERLRASGPETAREIAAALGQIGDRRALLPLCEALLDVPSGLDSALGEALVAIAYRAPGPELMEVLRRLERELEALDGESRNALEMVHGRLVRAAGPLMKLPIPAAAPEPAASSLPLPAAPAAPAAESLPRPAAGGAAPARPRTPHRSDQSDQSDQPDIEHGHEQESGPPAPATEALGQAAAASAAILRRFESVKGEAVRTWMGLQPVRVESNIVFRRGTDGAAISAAISLALLAFGGLQLLAKWLFGLQPPPALVGFDIVVLLLCPPVFGKASPGLRRLFFKIDAAEQEIVIYPLLVGRRTPKRKRLPLDRIDYFLGHLWNASDGLGDRLCAVLRDGSLELLTDNLGMDCQVETNVRILAVTCDRPAYLLDGRAGDDLIAVRADGSFAIRERAKLWARAKRLYTPEESAPAREPGKNPEKELG